MTLASDSGYSHATAFFNQVYRELQEIGYTKEEAQQMIRDKGLRGAGAFVETERGYAEKAQETTAQAEVQPTTQPQEPPTMLVVDTTTGSREFREVRTSKATPAPAPVAPAPEPALVVEAPMQERSAARIEADNDLATYGQLLTVPVVAVTAEGYKVVRHTDALEAALSVGSTNPRFRFSIWILNGKSAQQHVVTYGDWQAMTDPAPAPSEVAEVSANRPAPASTTVAEPASDSAAQRRESLPEEDRVALENLSNLRNLMKLRAEVNRLRVLLLNRPKLNSKTKKAEVEVEAYNLCAFFDVAYTVASSAPATTKAPATTGKAPTKAQLEDYCTANSCYSALAGINWRSAKQRGEFAAKVGYVA